MLQIKNLTKVYRTSKKVFCTAIDDVTLDLPSSGMVFITGKSGSGKSTLLNMIGTLDNITKGDIEVDGYKFSNFSEKDFQEYRSSYLGFIFQDFLLLEELTVKENILLALNISGLEDEEYFEKIIKKVDLVGKEDKFPSELSGGQRQRVAIARALIKKPKMLLCDEPTGNLDHKTSKQILDLLKAEAKDKLVIIVSHNLEDAENYADRIIELMDGKIVKDYTKNKNYTNHTVISDKHVVLPHHKDLNSKDLAQINELIKTTKFKVMQNKGGFSPTKEVELEPKEFKLQSSHISRKNTSKLSSMFFRKNKHGTPYTVLITALFISLFYIFQVFVSFNGNNSLSNAISSDSMAVVNIDDQMILGTISSSNMYNISDEQINQYKEAGYEGNIYNLTNYSITLKSDLIATGEYTRFPALFTYHSLTELMGTLCCTKEYLTSLYGQDGELVVLAGNLDEAQNKIIITDYFADVLLKRTKAGYTDYEGCLKANKNICAIIYTGYKERYSEVLKIGEQAELEKITTQVYMENNSKNENHIKFLKEVHDFLGIGYTFTNNIHDDLYKYSSNTINVRNFYIEKDGENIYIEGKKSFNYSSKFQNNDVQMSYDLYNELFGTFYGSLNAHTFVPHTAIIRKYENNDPSLAVIEEFEINITSLGSATYTSDAIYRKLFRVKYFTYGLYFDNLEQRDLVMDVARDQGFLVSTIDTPVVPVINTLLGLFKAFCYLIICLLFVVSVVHIVFYGIGSIKKNIYEIGVLKALGAKSFDIGKIFVSQIAIMGFAISIVSILGIYVSTIFSNMLLISAFEDFITITIFSLRVIVASPKIMSIDLTLVFILSIISSIIPLIYLRTIKPLNILKGKKK